MQVESQPNKYKIFQDYYLTVNGELISYSEALRLYSQLDDDTKLDFEKFYKDETGYEIIVSSGYNLDARHLENRKILNILLKLMQKNQAKFLILNGQVILLKKLCKWLTMV